MRNRPEALLLAVGALALAIAGVLVCTHQTVPSWDITVIVATLVGGGVATNPAGPTAIVGKLEAALSELVATHRAGVDTLLRDAAPFVTTVTKTTGHAPADPVTSVTPPVTSVTTPHPGTPSADPTAPLGG